MVNWLQRQANIRPDHVALRVPGEEFTWRRLLQRVERTAMALQIAGLQPGGRIAALAHNSVHYVALMWAAMWSGTTLVPLNARLTDEQLSWQLTHCGASLLVVDQSAAHRRLNLGEVRFVQIDDLTASFTANAEPFALEGTATMMFTSGTTGEPSLVRLSWANYFASATASALNLGVREDDDWLCCLPLFHVGGLSIITRGIIYGTAVTVLDRFDAAEVLEHLSGHITLISLVPTMLNALAECAGGVEELAAHTRRGKLRAILLSGAAAEPEFVRRCLDAGLPIVPAYGSTETCSQVVTMPLTVPRDRIGAAGFPLHGVDLELRNNLGKPITEGAGTIWVRGPMVSSGYVNPTPQARQRFVGGWFQTGDLGELDDRGFLWVRGRRDDVIITGGENVDPYTVERILGQHPDIVEIAVFGVPDPMWGQRVVAAVVGEVAADALATWCQTHLAPHERPREWRFKQKLPRTSLGKVQRQQLAAE